MKVAVSRSVDHSDYRGRCQAAGHAPQHRQIRLGGESCFIGYVVKPRKCCPSEVVCGYILPGYEEYLLTLISPPYEISL